MIVDWMYAWPTAFAAFLASAAEFVEALTVVLAVGAVRGRRGALTGTAAALAVLSAVVLLFGPLLTGIPLQDVRLVVGVLLPAFGTFRVGEGIGLDWPGSDWSILGLTLGFLAVASLAVPLCRRRAGTGPSLAHR